MKRKILACDLDGTLIKHNMGEFNKRSVLLKDKEKLQDFTNSGNLLIISTGRDKLSTFKLFEKEKLLISNIYFVTSNGAEIYNSNKERLFIKSLGKELAWKTIELFLACNREQYLECDVFDGDINYKLLNSADAIAFKNTYSNNIIHVCISSKRGKIEDVKKFYSAAKFQLKEASISINNWFVDVLPHNISKASAIRFIIKEHVNDVNFQLIAIGDSWNDIPMFEIADVSYTFNNSPNDVKNKATYLVNNLYECIDDLLGI